MRGTRLAVAGALAGVVLMVGGWFLLVFGPKGDEIADLRDQVRQAEDTESSLRSQVVRLEALDDDRPAVEAQLRRLTAAVPASPELASVILAMHDMATRSNLTFVQLTPTLPTSVDGVPATVISMGIEVEGPFFSVLDFLDRLEELERIIVVDQLSLTAQGPENIPPDQTTTGQPEAPTTAPATAAGAGGSEQTDEAGIDVSEIVRIATEFGDVMTDAGSINPQVAPAEPNAGPANGGQATAQLVSPPVLAPVGDFLVRATLTARTFTTGAPADAGSDTPSTTTTTRPPEDS